MAELYLGRADELARGRPLLTGDVLTNVDLDADDHDGTVMVIAHPCSMRGAGGRLLPRVVVAPVRRYQAIPFSSWPDGHFKVLPLPGLSADEDETSRAVALLELTAVRSTTLGTEHRILALTDRGIHILQQRLVYCLTRVEVGLEKLHDQMAHVLLEAELEEEWVDDLADEDDEVSIAAASAAFAAFMDEGHRAALMDPTRRSDVARVVRAEIRRRSE